MYFVLYCSLCVGIRIYSQTICFYPFAFPSVIPYGLTYINIFSIQSQGAELVAIGENIFYTVRNVYGNLGHSLLDWGFDGLDLMLGWNTWNLLLSFE